MLGTNDDSSGGGGGGEEEEGDGGVPSNDLTPQLQARSLKCDEWVRAHNKLRGNE